MKSVISYTLSHCVKCLKCLRICPTEAITIVHERVQIDSHKCINCGHCIEVCNTQGLQGKGSTLIDINNYDKTVALLPSALLSCCGSLKEAARLVEAIGQTGFDEVVQMSEVEGGTGQTADFFLLPGCQPADPAEISNAAGTRGGS